MEFLKKPKDNSHKKALWLILVLLILIGMTFLWQYVGDIIGDKLKLQKRIEINPQGSLEIDKKKSISDKKAELFARIARINEEPLTPYEKRTILAQFSSGNEMQLSTEEKATILEALNKYNR